GVLPASFREVVFAAHVWTPLVLPTSDAEPAARARSLMVFGRLASGLDLQQARTEMSALAERAEHDDPASKKGWGARVMTLQEYPIQEGHIRAALLLLMTAVMFVLMIACANIANLLLARGRKRAHEIAIRTALGAGRARVIRQLLVESVLIASIGGGTGL